MARRKTEVAAIDTTPPVSEQFAAQTLALQNDANQRLADVLTQFGDGLFTRAQEEATRLRVFKTQAMDDVASFVDASLEQYGVKVGGGKGNVTLMSYDGKYKVVRQMQDYIVFGEQLKAAKALIDACVIRWSEGANANIRVLVNDAFQVDKQGNINTGRVLGLRRLAIEDPEWQTAMKAISDSVQVATTRPYVRFYVRDDASGRYEALSLDMASV